MSNIGRLLKIQLLNMTGINKALHSHDKKEKIKYIAMGVLIFISILSLGFTSFLYSSMMSYSLEAINELLILPAIMMMITSLVILFTTIYKTKGILYAYKDYDLIMSLPIKTSHVIISRILLLYVLNLFFTLLIMVPMSIVYGLKAHPGALYYPASILGILLLPCIPILIATFLGALITRISLKFPYSNQVSLLLNIILIIGIFLLSFRTQDIVYNFSEIGKVIMNSIYHTYPVARFYVEGVCMGNILSFLIYAGLSLLVFLLFIWYTLNNYKEINTALTTSKAIGKFTYAQIKKASPLKALYIKERKRYFSSSNYVMNTAIGLVMLLMASGSLLFIRTDQLDTILEIPGFSHVIQTIAPLFTAAFLALSPTTTSAISLEGKNLWIPKTLPVPASTIFLSKVLVNLTLPTPVIVINAIILTMALHMNLFTFVMLILTPLIYNLFASYLGLFINIKFPNFTWTNEISIIKQSAAVLISMLANFVLMFALFALAFLLPESLLNLYILGVTLVLMGLCYGFIRYMNHKGDCWMRML